MQALLLVAHGSRRAQSNDEVRELAQKLKHTCGEQYPIIEAAFLELAEPLIPDGIRHCIDRGASTVTVLPYFLNSGRHVVEDIPGIVNDTKRELSNTEIKLAPHLGASDMMLELLVTTANAAA